MHLSPKDWIPLLMILASVVAIVSFLRPHYGDIQVLRAEKAEYEGVLMKANEARIMRESLLATYNEITPEEWKRLRKMLPSEPNGVQLVRDMSGLAGVFNIKLGKFSFNEDPSGGSIASPPAPVAQDSSGDAEGAAPNGDSPGIFIPVAPQLQGKKLQLSIDFVSSYPDFTRFLRELEKSLELSDVRSLSVSRGAREKDEKEGAGQVYNFSLSLDTYWIE